MSEPTNIVTLTRGQYDELMRDSANLARLRHAIEAALPTGEQFERQRAKVRAVYSDASERGFLLGSINAEEKLADRVHAVLAAERDPEAGEGRG